MNMCVVRVGEFLMNMMMFDPMGFGRGTPNVFRYNRPIRERCDPSGPGLWSMTTENVSIFVKVLNNVKQCLYWQLSLSPSYRLYWQIPCVFIIVLGNFNLFKSVFPSDSLIPTLTPTQTRGHSLLSPNPPTSVGSLLEDQDVPDDGDILKDAQRKEPWPRVIQMIPAANVSPRYSNCQHVKVPQKRTVSLIFIIYNTWSLRH